MALKVLLKTPLNPHSGYGTDGIGIAQALQGMGVDLYLDPSYVQTPLPKSVAGLLTKRLQAPFDLLLHHQDPGSLGISPSARRSAELAVAWTMWEFTTMDNCKGRSSLRKRFKPYDAVFGYDQVSTEALRPYVPGPLGTVQGGFWPDQWRPIERDWHAAPFRFCMVGALHERKDPFVAIEAFRQLLFEDQDFAVGAELHLKTVQAGLHPAMEQWAPGLRIHYALWSQEDLRRFYGDCHVLLAPSRGEGKNAPALEFQATGGPVIATNWGGHQQWLSGQYGYPLNYQLAPLNEATTPNCRNARADVEHLKALMLHCFRNRDEVARKGRLAAQIIPSMCGWNQVIDRLFTRLGELTGNRRLQHELRRLSEATTEHPALAEQYG